MAKKAKKTNLQKVINSAFYVAGLLFFGSIAVALFDGKFYGRFASDNSKNEQIKMGRAVYKAKNCNSCHGENGDRPAGGQYPKIAGQNYLYLVQQLKDITNGNRGNGMSGIMRASVPGGLTPQEIQSIARFLESR